MMQFVLQVAVNAFSGARDVSRGGCQGASSCDEAGLQRVSDHSLSVDVWVPGCPIRHSRQRRGHAKLVNGPLGQMPQPHGAEAVDA